MRYTFTLLSLFIVISISQQCNSMQDNQEEIQSTQQGTNLILNISKMPQQVEMNQETSNALFFKNQADVVRTSMKKKNAKLLCVLGVLCPCICPCTTGYCVYAHCCDNCCDK